MTKFNRTEWLAEIMREAVDDFDPDTAKLHHPAPETAPSNNLSKLPDYEIAEWMARWQNGMLH